MRKARLVPVKKIPRTPGRRPKDQFVPFLKQLTGWSIAAIGALLILWNAIVGAVVQGYIRFEKAKAEIAEIAPPAAVKQRDAK